MAPLVIALLAAAHAVDVPLALDLEEIVPPDEAQAIYYPDLVVTDDGTRHVLFSENISSELRYTHDGSGAWSTPVAVSPKSDSGPFNLEMTLDPDGRVAAVFDPGPGDVFGVARLDDVGTWSVDTYGSNARWMSIAFGDDGSLHGTFSGGTLQYATDASGTWVTEQVRGVGSFAERYPLAFFEDAPTPTIAFVDRADFSNPGVELAREVEGVWTFETLTDDGENPIGIARAEDGTLHAVFGRRDTSGDLSWVFAVDAGEGWTETATGLVSERTGVWEGSPVDLVLLGDQVVWADGEGGLRFMLGDADGWRTFVQPLDATVRTVRLERVGARLLALVSDDDSGVYLVELSLTDADADGVPHGFDLCPDLADPAQVDVDGDGTGDVCDCGDDGACTGWTDDGGWCDASTPERTDPDCDLCAIGPDADDDGVTDLCDECPDDPDKTEPGACGCGVEDTEPCPGEDTDEPEGCGCATESAAGGLAMLGLLAVGLRVRRRR